MSAPTISTWDDPLKRIESCEERSIHMFTKCVTSHTCTFIDYITNIRNNRNNTIQHHPCMNILYEDLRKCNL